MTDESLCACLAAVHSCNLIALTGGPGAGKTAVLEVVRRHLCRHVAVLPEAATIVFGGGFPRGDEDIQRRAAQCAIFHVQRQLERMTLLSGTHAMALCDRGTIDGLAYWPGSAESYFAEVGTTLSEELSRYAAVVHLRTPAAGQGYDRSNPLRIESAAAAAEVDARIQHAWQAHPKRIVIESSATFLEKLLHAVTAIREQLPECCRKHPIPEVDAEVQPRLSPSR